MIGAGPQSIVLASTASCALLLGTYSQAAWAAAPHIHFQANRYEQGVVLRRVDSNANILLGISTGGLRGISTGGLRGISTGGLRGISTGGLRGISTGGLRGISTGGLRGISTGGLNSTSNDEYVFVAESGGLPIVAIGPVTQVSNSSASVTIMGNLIVFDDFTETIYFDRHNADPKRNLGPAGSDLLSVGDYVVVAGEIMDPGVSLGTILVRLPELYVGGSSLVYLRSQLDSVNGSTGWVQSGKAEIDLTPSLHRSLTKLSPGDVIETIGFNVASSPDRLTATYSSVILEQDNSTTSHLSGISTGGLRGISTGGLRGISTGGLRGISTGGLRGISTGGLRGISTGGLRGISTGGLK